MNGHKFFNRMGRIQKSVKNFSNYHGSLVINKNVFFLNNSETKHSIFLRNINIIQNINSFNLWQFEFILLVSFWEKN